MSEPVDIMIPNLRTCLFGKNSLTLLEQEPHCICTREGRSYLA